MDITLNSADLARELSLLEKIISQKPVIPILANVFVQADAAGGLRLATTNLEVAFVTSCQALVSMPGTVTLPVDKLLGIARLLTGDVRLTLEESSHVRLRAADYNARLPTMSAADFPQIPTMKGLKTVQLSRVDLWRCLTKVRRAVSTKNTHMSLNGALLVAADGKMTAVATDSHRLALATAVHAGDDVSQVIIPVNVLDELIGMLAEGGDVTFAQSDRHLFFACDGRLIVSRMLAGKYPAYERIIPKPIAPAITFDVTILRLALQRVCLMADETKTVDVEFSTGVARVTTATAQEGDAGEQIAVSYTGEPLTVCVSGPYVLDFLDAADAGPAELRMKDAASPLLFTQGSYTYVLMPIKR